MYNEPVPFAPLWTFGEFRGVFRTQKYLLNPHVTLDVRSRYTGLSRRPRCIHYYNQRSAKLYFSITLYNNMYNMCILYVYYV